MILLYERKENCCGCTACMSICPEQAIAMNADEEGFLYPVINENLCIKCDLCKQICPFHDNYRVNGNYDHPQVYAAKHRNNEVRMNSSSGGVFTAISDYILGVDGIIYGAAFDKNFIVRHQKAETAEERNKFRGSKYVQSNLTGVFGEIKNELKKGRTVLFTGTPCQNAGLRSYLGESYDNLFLCDLVCHGTPSPLIFESYIKYCEKKNKSSIKQYYFRFKGNGWHSHTEKAVYANGKEDSTSLLSQSYKVLFYSHVALRPACHNCKFCNFSRPSDITIGDFWGIEKSMPGFDDNIGISLVLINSPKGNYLFHNISKDVYYRESNTRDCLQHNLHAPSPVSPKRDKFWQDYKKRGFEYVLKKYAGHGFVGHLKKLIVKIMKKIGLLHYLKWIFRR